MDYIFVDLFVLVFFDSPINVIIVPSNIVLPPVNLYLIFLTLTLTNHIIFKNIMQTQSNLNCF